MIRVIVLYPEIIATMVLLNALIIEECAIAHAGTDKTGRWDRILNFDLPFFTVE